MKQQLGIITLGINDLQLSKKFYVEGFNWDILYEDQETAMYQMNGFVLSTWLQTKLEKDLTVKSLQHGAALTLGHNVGSSDDVQIYLDRLSRYGGKILRAAGPPAHGGVRGYITDPDNHIWEIIYNPAWKVNNLGHVTFSPSN